MTDIRATPRDVDTLPEPGERWTFDQDVAERFPDMLERSIPDYQTMRSLTFDLGSRFVQPGTAIADIGCSRGEALAPFIDRFGARNSYLGLDSSEPMVALARERFGGFGGLVTIQHRDLARESYPKRPASLTLAVLTLMFVPVEHRQRVLRDIYTSTVPGGALVLVEKVLSSDDRAEALMTEAYHDMKRAHGYSDHEVEAKARALEGVLVSWATPELERALRAAGFRTVEPFWRAYQFGGWVAVRDGA